MKKPLIGITPSHDGKAKGIALHLNYCNAIREAGGLPLVLPLELSAGEVEELSERLDGLLLSGGPDIHPFAFGEETLSGCGNASILRDKMEFSFFKHMFDQKKPILGICRGSQLINIALGGNIYQDIFSQTHEVPRIAHIQPFDYGTPCHKVQVLSGTKLHRILGCSLVEVNSCHHQAVKDPATGLIICGRASDGLAEAVEMPDYPYLIGVQWHPEYLFEHFEHAKNIFHSFVEACPS